MRGYLIRLSERRWTTASVRPPRSAAISRPKSGVEPELPGSEAVPVGGGVPVGTAVGTAVGTSVGTSVGTAVGTSVGTSVGTAVGTSVGTSVGTGVGQPTDCDIAAARPLKSDRV